MDDVCLTPPDLAMFMSNPFYACQAASYVVFYAAFYVAHAFVMLGFFLNVWYMACITGVVMVVFIATIIDAVATTYDDCVRKGKGRERRES